MRRLFSIVIGLLIMVSLTHCEGGVSSGKTLIKVNRHKITEGDLEFLSTINPNLKAQLATPFGRQQLIKNLIEQELLYQAATKQGLHHEPTVKAKIDLYRHVIIAQSLIDNSLDEAAEKYYEENKDEFETLQMSHIMVGFTYAVDSTKSPRKQSSRKTATRSEEEALQLAKKIRQDLEEETSFEEAAKEYSDDATTKFRGGNLGRLSRKDKRLDRRGFTNLIEKAFTMKVGEVSEPIKSAKGYHIITVTEPAEQALYADVERQIKSKLRSQTRKNVLEKLKEKAKIVYVDESLAPNRSGTPQMPPHIQPHDHSHDEGSGQMNHEHDSHEGHNHSHDH